jgi:hypothetical protein
MATYNITFTGTALPGGWSGTLEDFHQAVLASLSATVSDDRLLFGQYNGATPSVDVGPWMDSGVWKYWNGSSYTPALFQVTDGSTNFRVSLTAATLGSNRVQTLQDADGVIALTDDVFVPRANLTPTGAGPYNIDFSLTNAFKLTVGANFTITFSNALPGQHTWLAVVNSSGGGITPTFPAEAHITPTSIATGTTSLFIMRNIGGTIYVEQLNGYV